MRTRKYVVLLTVIGWAGPLALAQPDPGGPDGPGRPGPRFPRGPRDPNRPVPPAGFWPTPRMMEQIIGRMAEGMRNHYSLDYEQVAQTRELFKEKFPQWLEENRGELQDLMNGYIESIMSETPPTPEDVAQWAARIEPLMEQFSQLADETAAEMGTYLRDDQLAILNGETAVMHMAFDNFRGRLQNWKSGGFDYETEWPGGSRFRETQQAQAEQFQADAEQARSQFYAVGRQIDQPMGGPQDGMNGAAGGAGMPGGAGMEGGAGGVGNPQRGAPGAGARAPAAPEDEWSRYTEDFIRRYKLVEDQQVKARQFLKSQQDQRDQYLRRKMSEIDALGKRLDKAQKAQDEAEVAKVKADYEKLNKPVDNMFQRLKDRLDTLPTRKQRSEAGKSELTKPAKTELKPAGKTDKAP